MPIRKKMTGVLLVWILLGVLGFVGVRNEAVFSAREAASRKTLSDLTVKAETELGRFTNAIEAMLRIAAKWGMEGELDGAGIPGLCAKFVPVLDEYKRVSGLILATGLGKEIFLNRKGGAWALELSGIDPASVDLASVPGVATRVTEVRKSLPGYDPRSRPWFRKAAMSDAGDLKVAWTAPYRFFNERQEGITASLGWTDSSGVDHIVAADVLLKDYLDFLASLDPGPQARIFLAKDDRSLILPAQPDGLFTALLQYWARGVQRGDTAPLEAGTLSFSFQGRKWRAETRPLGKQKGRLVLGVLMPEPQGIFRIRAPKTFMLFLLGVWSAVFGVLLWHLFYRRSPA